MKYSLYVARKDEGPKFIGRFFTLAQAKKVAVTEYLRTVHYSYAFVVAPGGKVVWESIRKSSKNAGGKGFMFHGSFTSKLAAKKKEARTPGSFIQEKDGRYYVLKPKRIRSANKSRTPGLRQRSANPKGVLIYDKITRIEGTKGKDSSYAGQRFFHNFKRPYPKMYGLPDGSLLIK